MGPSDHSPAAATSPLLTIAGAEIGYGRKRVLTDISLTVGAGEAIALLGHNGVGKTTLLCAIFGLLPLRQGSLAFAGSTLTAHNARAASDLGMAMIPAERFVFPDLTVIENLRLSARGLSPADRDAGIEAAFVDFPILEERAGQLAGSMSGGQQRMVSLAMALMRKPRLLLLDEPSLGLSPAITEQMMARMKALVAGGMSIVLVEQNVPAALSVASRIYVLRAGRIILEETASAMAARGRENWWELF